MARTAIRSSVLVGVGFLVVWQLATALDAPRTTVVGFAIYGFVFHVIFGKAYALVPAYFDRELASPWGPRTQVPLTATGAVLLGLGPFVPGFLLEVGVVLWATGAGIFVLTLVATIADNLHGAETGTGAANRHRRRVDRYANAFVPVALAYFAVGTYETVATLTALQPLLDGAPPQATHLLAAGTATLLILSIGARLLPRFFVAEPPWPVILAMLPAGAIAPLLLVVGFQRGALFVAGASILWAAVAGYLVVIATLAVRTERRRIGFGGVVLGSIAGLLGVSVGLYMALVGATSGLVSIHVRLLTLGFLGLTIVGVLYQFYPPSIGTLPLVSDRGAGASLALMAGGVAVEVIGAVIGLPTAIEAGRWGAALGAFLVAWILIGLTLERGPLRR